MSSELMTQQVINYTVITRTPEGQTLHFNIGTNELLGQLIIEVISWLGLSNEITTLDVIHDNHSLYDYNLESPVNILNLGDPIEIDVRKTTSVLKVLDILKKVSSYTKNHNITLLKELTSTR